MDNINENEEVCYDFEYLYEGKNYFQDTGSKYQVLWFHLLKFKFQPNKQTTSWVNTIKRSINEINEIRFNSKPKIKNGWSNFIKDSTEQERRFKLAVNDAAGETGLSKNTFYKSLAEAMSAESVFNPIYTIDENIVKQYLLKYYNQNCMDHVYVLDKIENLF